jgi:hypothetical protein
LRLGIPDTLGLGIPDTSEAGERREATHAIARSTARLTAFGDLDAALADQRLENGIQFAAADVASTQDIGAIDFRPGNPLLMAFVVPLAESAVPGVFGEHDQDKPLAVRQRFRRPVQGLYDQADPH